MARTPHGYHDTALIRSELAEAGFSRVVIETRAEQSRASSASVEKRDIRAQGRHIFRSVEIGEPPQPEEVGGVTSRNVVGYMVARAGGNAEIGLRTLAEGRFGKQDFVYLPMEDVYLAMEDVYRCPAGEKLAYRFTNEEQGKTLRHYSTTACPRCPIKSQCTPALQRRITRWEHEHVLEAVQQRLD